MPHFLGAPAPQDAFASQIYPLFWIYEHLVNNDIAYQSLHMPQCIEVVRNFQYF